MHAASVGGDPPRPFLCALGIPGRSAAAGMTAAKSFICTKTTDGLLATATHTRTHLTTSGAARIAPGMSFRAIAVDGKSARGTRQGEGRAVHLLAAFDSASGIVLGQAVVDGKTNEITAFAPLLSRIDITDATITTDALHTQDDDA